MQSRLRLLNLEKTLLEKFVIFPEFNSGKIRAEIKTGAIPDILKPVPQAISCFFRCKNSCERDLIIEICSGTGDFIIPLACNNPDKLFLGIDYSLPAIERAVKKVYNRAPANLLFYCGSMEDFFEHTFSQTRCRAVYINYPDPWPKKKHSKRRILNAEKIQFVLNTLQAGGIIIIATDSQILYEFAVREIKILQQAEKINLRELDYSALTAWSGIKTVFSEKAEKKQSIVRFLCLEKN